MKNNLTFWHKILPPSILSLITILFYAPTLKFPFIYDDMPTITENIHVIRGSFLNKGTIFGISRWISRLLHSFLYKVWGENPTPFRIFNLFMHISIGIMIFILVLKLLTNLKNNPQTKFLKTNAYLISIVSSGLFLLHPTQTQTVTYITQMSLEGMVTFFTFAILTSFVFAVYSKNIFSKILLYTLPLVLVVFAAGTKEIIITLPFLILLVDIVFIAQGNFKELTKRLFFHLSLFTILLLSLAQFGFLPIKFAKKLASTPLLNNRGNILTENIDQKIESGNFLISQFKVLLHYLRIYFWPKPLAFEYGFKLTQNIFKIDFILPFISILCIILSVLFAFIKNNTNAFSFGLAWFFIGILPRASFIPSTELICDYKTYISSFGLIFLISVIFVFAFQFILEKIKRLKSNTIVNIHNSQLVLIILLIMVSAYSTKTQNKIWKDELSYWGHAVKVSPNKGRLLNNYGVALSTAKRIDESIETYKKACKADPDYTEPIINLAFHYQARGDYDLAMEQYKKAINMREFHPEMYLNLGSLHLTKKRYKEAEICFDIALKHRPYYSRAHFNKGVMYEQQGMLGKALDSFESAINGNYKNIQFYFKHANAAMQLNQYDKAIKSFEIVKKENPRFSNTILNLAKLYYQKRDYKNAAINFEIVYNQDKNNKVSAYNLAQSLLNIKEYNKALRLFESCQNEENLFPYAKLHIAKCYKDTNNNNKALIILDKLIKNPPHLGVKNDAQLMYNELKHS